MDYKVLLGDNRLLMPQMPTASVRCIVTSPPYWSLRDYGHEDQLGQERTPEEYVANLVSLFHEARRVLTDDGTLWLNLGDSYNGSGGAGGDYNEGGLREGQPRYAGRNVDSLKPKDLVGIPWRVAFALQSDGWFLRSDIIWCLSGGTSVYVRTQKGDTVMTVKDMARLDPSSIKLWNGDQWTMVLGMSKSPRQGNEMELVLRSGERISCTPTHKFPTERGLLGASELQIGDCLLSVKLPEPEETKDSDHIGIDAAWFAGLYIAEGSRSEDTIQFAGHVREEERWSRIQAIAKSYGGSATRTIDNNKMDIRVYGKILNALLDQLVSGRTAEDKCMSPVCWRYSNSFLRAMLDGYLSGDGHWDAPNHRWRLGFNRNYNLERDLRTLSARLGFSITLNPSTSEMNGKSFPSFRGEIRFSQNNHHNVKSRNEIVDIRKARCRDVYDVGVSDEPHVFALASGILTHNSKPNPMPESVRDRPTKSHEYIFLLAKSPKYYYDACAIAEKALQPTGEARTAGRQIKQNQLGRDVGTLGTNYGNATRNRRSVWTPDAPGNPNAAFFQFAEWVTNVLAEEDADGYRILINRYLDRLDDKTDVWRVTTKPYEGAHFAVFPPELIEPCILAGSAPGDTVLDPFNGSGTTGAVALKHGRKYLGMELNPDYIPLTDERITQVLADLGKIDKPITPEISQARIF